MQNLKPSTSFKSSFLVPILTVLLATFCPLALAQNSTCIAQNQFIALDPELVGLDDLQNTALGAYERVSPDGRFVLRSFSGKKLSTVSLIELPAPGSKQGHLVYSTPLSNEAFPVQGSWRYLVEVSGAHYTFQSILEQGNKAQPLFNAGMTGFYAAAAELNTSYPQRTSAPVQIRSLSWPNAAGRGELQGVGTLSAKTVTVDAVKHTVIDPGSVQNLCLDRLDIDGNMYALPMISVSGKEFAAMPQNPQQGGAWMRVFGFGESGKQCQNLDQLQGPSGKVTFGFSGQNNGQNADLVYEYLGQIWWYSSQFKTSFNIAPWEANGQAENTSIIASAFPGVTRDGRIIYAASWKNCQGSKCKNQAGYIVADPWQSNAWQHFKNQYLAKNGPSLPSLVAQKKCITQEQVLQERKLFAQFHGLGQ
jgi:hypothetical protein